MPGALIIALMALAGLLAQAGMSDRAWAQKRVALVIGNSAYKHTGELPNPRNDAVDMAAALARHGFQVIEGLDLDKTAFDRKVRDFAVALEGASAGVFFYAGHGISVGGQNYLVPVDAELTSAVALEFEMVRAEVIHRVMERQTSTNILFLDACRDNPLSRNLARSMGTRSMEIGKGLAAVESGVGTLISFSTQPGNVALDGTGRNSPFAGALIKQLSTSSEDLGAILIAVRNDVMKQTERRQIPWEHSALTGRFYFTPPAAAKAPERDAASSWMQLHDASASELFTADDLQRITELAKGKSIPVPDFRIRRPASDVPEKFLRFVGIWVSDLGWGDGMGRQFMMIITNVDSEGRVIGHFGLGPPTPASFIQRSARHYAFSGNIGEDEKLTTRSPVSVTRGAFKSPTSIELLEQFDDGKRSSVVLLRAWSLVEAEQAARR
jgi:uncharacterized caspase-like protein